MTCKKCTDAESAIALAEKRASDLLKAASRYKACMAMCIDAFDVDLDETALEFTADGKLIEAVNLGEVSRELDAAIRSITSKDST